MILACSFLFLWHLGQVLVHGDGGLAEWVGNAPPSTFFWNSLTSIGIITSLPFESIHLWSPGHFFVGDFWSQLVVLVIDLFIVRACDWCWCLTYSYFLFLPGSALEDCTFLRICPFVPGYPFYCHAVVSSCLLWSFLFLCCLLKRLLFHFKFIWVGCLLWGHIELDTTEAT